MGIHRMTLIGLLIVSIAAIILGVFALEEGQGEPDFLAYWAAARLLVTGENPYDPVALRALVVDTRPDRQVDRGGAFASWNPPWLLIALLPFGLLPFDVAVSVWMLCNIALLGAAPALTWRLVGEPSDKRAPLVVFAASLLSGQSLTTMLTGQISSLILIGLVLGAWCLHSGRDRLAGGALFLATIKPHLTYLLLFLLALWIIRTRRSQILWGMITVGMISIAVLQALCPSWWPGYFTLLGSHYSLLLRYVTPTVGSLAQALWGTHIFRFAGVLLVPLALPLVELANSRGWLTAMNLALLVSIPLAMYGFNADQVVLLPAIVQIVSWLWHGQLPPQWARAIGGGLVLTYVASFAMLLIPNWRYCYWFALIPLAWAGLYVLALRHRTPAAAEA